MSFIGDIVGGIFQRNAAKSAAQLQSGAAQAGIGEQQRQFNTIVELMAPFVGAGAGAVGAQAE